MIAYSQSIISDFMFYSKPDPICMLSFVKFVSFHSLVYAFILLKSNLCRDRDALYYIISVIIMVHQYTLHRLSSYVVDSFMTDNWWAGCDI